MRLAHWYLYKADQCRGLAKAATDADKRASYEEEQKVWLVALAEHLKPDNDSHRTIPAVRARRVLH